MPGPAYTPEPQTANERALVRLAGLPVLIPVLAVLALLVIGALVPGYGWIATAVVVLFLGWMLALSWPRLTRVEKLMRIAVLIFLAAITLVQARPR